MTRDQVVIAIEEGIPFVLKMADGEKYEVTQKHQIALGKTNAFIVDEEGLAHILPLLTMTGITYLQATK
jgi:hypothetical protein